MIFGLSLQLLLFAAGTAFGARTWYVDGAATGANNGTNWANAFTDVICVDKYTGRVAPGDTVFIKGYNYGSLTNASPSDAGITAVWRLQGGSSGNWTHYYFTNGVTTIFRSLNVPAFTEVNGCATLNYETNLVGTYDTLKITNNCNLHIVRTTNWYDVGSYGRSINVSGEPTTLKWIHMTGSTDIGASGTPDHSDSAQELFYFQETAVATNEAAYLWIDLSSGHGAGAAIAAVTAGQQFGIYNIHHCLIETNYSDIANIAGGTDFHHNIVRRRGGISRGGCNDMFTLVGDPSHIRIYNNVLEPTDNAGMYAWGSVSNIHDFFFYGNILKPVEPLYNYTNAGAARGGSAWEQDMLPAGQNYYMRSNVFIVNNTWAYTTNCGWDAVVSLISKNIDTGLYIMPGAFVIKNNLLINVDPNVTTPTAIPFGFQNTANSYGKGWLYDSNSIVLDYNLFWAYTPGDIRIANWGACTNAPVTLANAADVARVLGYTHNVSTTPVRFIDAPSYDYRPASAAVNVGQDLSSLVNLMPDLNRDIYGNVRGQSGMWSAGAIEYTPITPTAPSIVTQPADQIRTAGDNVTFSVGAAGSSPLGYQWSFNGTSVPGATFSSYALSSVTTNNAGGYSVVVANAYGSVTSAVASLTINPAGTLPTITAQPQSLTLATGSAATFTVAATGSNPLSYQWLQNGISIAGATSTSYTTSQAADFRAVVSNTYGSVTSQVASLTLTNAAGTGTGSVTNGLVLWLTFDQADGWTTNHVITDKSGRGNHAYYMPSTNRNTWPSWTPGPNNLSAAQFVVNYTNGFRYGTYAAITSLSSNAANSGLAAFTKGTWACWAFIDNAHILGDSGDDLFLSCGQDLNNWHFGKFYSDSPQFWRTMTSAGEAPLESYANWPNVTTSTAWQHYAISWDGTNLVPYLNGVAYTDTLHWTNENSGFVTNQYTGVMVSTNSAGPYWSYIAVGVNSHGGTPNPDDADGLPNNGQLWGRLADMRIYDRPLSAAEINAIYSGNAVAGKPSPPTGFKILAAPYP